ncbi:MAG: hypothetical protein ACLFWL_13675 [Candidatus Brocadiia bacterium]|nr:hypothetical protein [Planctomycetota bacterium]
MCDEIQAVLATMKEQYPLTICEEGDFVHLDVRGTRSNFRLTVSRSDNILFSDVWHIHFGRENPLTLHALLEGLFEGTIQVVVKFRGDMPVGQKVRVIQDDGPHHVSWSGVLLSPFWRRKSYRTFTYETASKTMNADQ